MRSAHLPILPLLLAALPLRAEVPQVVADSPPLHSLVARAMEGVGQPDLLLPPGASVHHYSFRPSDAARLSGADLVFWVGEGLTPWLAAPVGTLAGEARIVEMLETPGWMSLPLREDAAFADGHDHGHDHDHHHGPAGGVDPHAWLDPAVASAWLGTIAAELAGADPENAATYLANAEAGAGEFTALAARIEARLAPLRGRGYIVPHDSLQYFETAFDLPAAGAIALGDAAAPGAARIAELRDLVRAGEIRCILTDRETGGDWAAVIGEGVATAEVDPEGTTLEPGPGLYPALIDGLSASLATCVGG